MKSDVMKGKRNEALKIKLICFAIEIKSSELTHYST